MRNWVLTVLSLTVLLAGTSFARADDPPARPGLQPGDDLPGPFQPYNITGKEKHRGKFHCLVSENSLNPAVAVFVRGSEVSEPVMKLLEKLDEAIPRNERIRLGSFVVFMSEGIMDVVKEDDQREKESAEINDKTNKLKYVAAALDSFAAIKPLYKLDDQAEVTVVLYNKYKVVLNRSFPREGLKDEELQKLMDDLEAKLAAIRTAAGVKAIPAPKK
jgi:ribosomal protein L29